MKRFENIKICNDFQKFLLYSETVTSEKEKYFTVFYLWDKF